MEQDYFNLCDRQFDKEFDSVETLKRYPWVGNKYAKSNYRILILGDSHYAVDDDKNPSEDEYNRCNTDKDYTRRVVRCVINDVCDGKPTWTMFRNLINTFTSYTPYEVKHLWSKVAFYNFIQEPMEQINQVPTSKERITGWRCFYDVINILKPDFCLFVGVRSKQEIEMIRSLGGTYTIGDDKEICNKITPCYGEIETKEGNKTRFRIIKHTSRFYSPDEWYQYFCNKEQVVMRQLDRNY